MLELPESVLHKGLPQKVRTHFFLGLTFIAALAGASGLMCSGAQIEKTGAQVVDCSASTLVGQVANLIPKVMTILADPTWTNVEQALVALAKVAGSDVVACTVAAIQQSLTSSSTSAPSMSLSEAPTILSNANQWLKGAPSVKNVP